MFEICHRILKPQGYFATTIIHFNQFVDPYEIITGSKAHMRGSDDFHFAKVLMDDFGGWYPIDDQLQKCAHTTFTLKLRQEGTEDYHWTSEYWLKKIRQEIQNPRMWIQLLEKAIVHPQKTISMLDNLICAQSWMWQFRKRSRSHDTPTKLFRDVWQKI